MREVTSVKRNKKVYFLSLNELKKGEWLSLLEDKEKSYDDELLEIDYKNGHLTVSRCNIKRVNDNSVKENGEHNNERRTNE